MCLFRDTLTCMTDTMHKIADKVRGVAAEKRCTHQQIAGILNLDRKSVGARLNGRVAFTAAELHELSLALGVDVAEFFPRALERAA